MSTGEETHPLLLSKNTGRNTLSLHDEVNENDGVLKVGFDVGEKSLKRRSRGHQFVLLALAAIGCSLLILKGHVHSEFDETKLGATTYYENPVYTDQNTDPMTEKNVNDIKTSRLAVTLHTGCSPHEKLPWSIEDKSTWGQEVGAKIIFKSDTNDFFFERGVEMENVGCGSYSIETEDLLVGMQFGFALYQKNNQTAHQATKDIGCRSESDSDTRCPSWKSPHGDGIRGGPMEMTECTFQYKYGAVTFYNRVFDGETTDYVWGSCLDTCPAFTRAPYCGKSEEVPQIGQLELREDEKCTPGEYLQANGKCQRCPVGHYSGEAEASECQPCAAGTMQPNEGQTECIACPNGWYQSEIGQQYCESCPGSRADSSRRKLQGGMLDKMKHFDWSKFGSVDGWEWIQNTTETIVNKTETAYDDAKNAVNSTLTSGADAVKQSAKKASDAVSDTFSKTKESAEDSKDTVDAAAADAKEKTDDAIDDAKKSAEKTTEDSKETVDDAVNGVKKATVSAEEAAEDAAHDAKENVEKTATTDPKQAVDDAAHEVKKATVSAEEAAEDAANASKESVEDAVETVEDAAEKVKFHGGNDSDSDGSESSSSDTSDDVVVVEKSVSVETTTTKEEKEESSGPVAQATTPTSISSDETSSSSSSSTTTSAAPTTTTPSTTTSTPTPTTPTSTSSFENGDKSTNRGATSLAQCPSASSSSFELEKETEEEEVSQIGQAAATETSKTTPRASSYRRGFHHAGNGENGVATPPRSWAV
ncbi:unnamed protein product [Bathycoccus prasinos]